LEAYDKNRTLLFHSLTDLGFEATYPGGAFYLFMKSPDPDANVFCERARQYELLLVPSDDFGVTGYVRISYCVSTRQIERSIPAFEKLAPEYDLI
jgi:aspartate aminotransferase